MSNYNIKQPIAAIPFLGAWGQQFYLTWKEELKHAEEASFGETKLKKPLVAPRRAARHSYVTHTSTSGPHCWVSTGKSGKNGSTSLLLAPTFLILPLLPWMSQRLGIYSFGCWRMMTFYVLGNEDTALNEIGMAVAFMKITVEQER